MKKVTLCFIVLLSYLFTGISFVHAIDSNARAEVDSTKRYVRILGGSEKMYKDDKGKMMLVYSVIKELPLDRRIISGDFSHEYLNKMLTKALRSHQNISVKKDHFFFHGLYCIKNKRHIFIRYNTMMKKDLSIQTQKNRKYTMKYCF